MEKNGLDISIIIRVNYSDIESPIEMVIVDVELIFGFKIGIFRIKVRVKEASISMTSVISSPSVCSGMIKVARPCLRAAPDEQGEHEHEHVPARGPAAALRQKPVPQHRQKLLLTCFHCLFSFSLLFIEFFSLFFHYCSSSSLVMTFRDQTDINEVRRAHPSADVSADNFLLNVWNAIR